MGPGGTFAAVTFLSGFMALLGWLYLTTDNPRCGKMIKNSLLLFVVPLIFVPMSWFQFPLSMWAWTACEEGLKVLAAKSERNRFNRFWIVSLFGVWELMLSKPIWGLVIAASNESWDRLHLAGLIYATALPVLMHTVTAAIYAFRFEGRLWAAFMVCWIIHTAFNETVTYFELSVPAALTETLVLAMILLAILPRRGQWLAEEQPASS